MKNVSWDNLFIYGCSLVKSTKIIIDLSEGKGQLKDKSSDRAGEKKWFSHT